MLNEMAELKELKSVPHRDFYNVRKVGWQSGFRNWQKLHNKINLVNAVQPEPGLKDFFKTAEAFLDSISIHGLV